MAKWVLAKLAAGVAVAGAVAVTAQPSRQAPTAAAKAGQPMDRSILHVQVVLDKLGFGPGILDGRPGMSLTAALKGFQESRGLPVTGEVDSRTLSALKRYAAWRPTKQLTLTAAAVRDVRLAA